MMTVSTSPPLVISPSAGTDNAVTAALTPYPGYPKAAWKEHELQSKNINPRRGAPAAAHTATAGRGTLFHPFEPHLPSKELAPLAIVKKQMRFIEFHSKSSTGSR